MDQAAAVENGLVPAVSMEQKETSVDMLENVDVNVSREKTTAVPVLNMKTTGFMIFFSFWIGLGGWLINFDLGYTGIVLQMQPFNRSFGHCVSVPNSAGGSPTEDCALSAGEQSIVSIYILFLSFGSGLTSIAGSYIGRRRVLQLGCLLTIIGAAGMLGTAKNYAAYIACKCIGGAGLGLISTTAPVYGTECTPAKTRGSLVACYSVGLAMGQIVVALVCLGTSKIQNDWSWKIPILCQIPVATIYACGLEIFPESPRWLMVMGRVEEARKAFGEFYKIDPHSEEVSAQIRDVQETINAEISAKLNASPLEIFSRSYRVRTFVAAAIVIGSSLSGITFVVPYATIFLSGLGIKNPYSINVYLNLCIFGGTLFGPWLCQNYGRRRTILTGYLAMTTCMLIIAIGSSGLGSTSPVSQKVLVAFLSIWDFIFGGFNASAVWLSSAEQHSVRYRTYGQAFTMAVNYIFNFASTFWSPYMINKQYGNMGTNVGYFWAALTLFYFVFMFLILPETGGLTLEQIDRYYTSGTRAWRTSLKKNKES